MEIREMVMEDLDQIMQMEEESFASPWTRESMESELLRNPLAKYLVIAEGDVIFAYGGMWIILDEGHITNLAVRKTERGKGLGNFLIYGMLDYAKKMGVKDITLEVRRGNDPALHLYKKYGFVQEGVRASYYEDGEDALILWKRVKEDKDDNIRN